MAHRGVFWYRAGRHLSAICIAAFLLPFFGVSYLGRDVVMISGANMVGGCAPTRRGPREPLVGPPSPAKPSGEICLDLEQNTQQPLAIVALGLAIALFATSWLRGHRAAAAGLVISLAALGVLAGLWSQMTDELIAGIECSGQVSLAASSHYGLWFTAALFAVTAGATGWAVRPRAAPAEAAIDT